MKKFIHLTIIIFVVVVGFSYGGSQDKVTSINLPTILTELKPGDGREKVEEFCNICHSVDYITMQPKLSNAQWTVTVTKMIKVFGAPVSEKDAEIIVNYLTTSYGTGN